MQPGDETQWDWLDLPDPPQLWGWGRTAHLLVGSLAYSAKWRGWLSPCTDQPHLVEGLDRVARALGGVTRSWRFDRMATVCDPGSRRVSASFVAKHYSVSVRVCPPRSGNRKGLVEKANLTAAQRWWRTLPDDVTVEQAQARLDRFTSLRADTRVRVTAEGRSTVAAIADTEPLASVPAAPYPVIVAEQRSASRQALVAYRGNRYSVPPELAMAQVTVSRPVGGQFLDIATPAGIVVARHRLLADGLGATVRDSGHVIALDAAAMAAAHTGRAHRRKERIPPGPAARAAATELRERLAGTRGSVRESSAATTTDSTVIDLSVYERAAQQKDHPEMTSTDNTSLTMPATAEAASRYQRLRGHLAALKLHAAAEALPAVLDQASRRGTVADRGVGAAAGHRGRRHRGPPAGRSAAVRLPAHPGHPGRLRRRRRRRGGPQAHR